MLKSWYFKCICHVRQCKNSINASDEVWKSDSNIHVNFKEQCLLNIITCIKFLFCINYDYDSFYDGGNMKWIIFTSHLSKKINDPTKSEFVNIFQDEILVHS